MNHTDELEFAYKVRRALDQCNAMLPAVTVARLSTARHQALTRRKRTARVAVPLLAAIGAPLQSYGSWLQRLGVAAPLLAGLLLFVGLYQYEQQSHINDLADLDAAVLTDDLPLSAYADHGFNVYLAKRGD